MDMIDNGNSLVGKYDLSFRRLGCYVPWIAKPPSDSDGQKVSTSHWKS